MRRLFRFVAIAIIAVAGASYLAGSVLSAPAMNVIGPPPTDLNVVDVEFAGVKGWFVSAGEGSPCLLLMHGVRSDRRSMIERARLLRQAGYSALLFDFQAHGESPGQHVTFGYRESSNARAAVSLLRSKFKCPKVAAIGHSLGGAAALLGDGPIEVDALILEAVYPTIDEAVAARLNIRLGDAGALLAPLLTLQLKPRLGIDSQDLRPVSRIGKLHSPVLIMTGAEDKHTPLEQARRLFSAANEPKEFWMIDGAEHVDLQKFSPVAYRNKILAFLAKHLGAPNSTKREI